MIECKKQNMKNLLNCIKSETKKLNKKHRKTQKIIKKTKYNSKFLSPKLILKIYDPILQYPDKHTDMQIIIAKRMVEKANKTLKKNKHKKLKKISQKEMKMYKDYNHELKRTIRNACY